MNENLSETLDRPEITETRPKRTFLIILSVFTFINSGARIFIGVFLLILMNAFSSFKSQQSNEDRWLTIFAFALLFSAGFSIVAAIMMLIRKRAGFWVYITGQLIFLLGSFAFTELITDISGIVDIRQYLIIFAMFMLPLLNLLLYYFAVRKAHVKTIDE